MKAHRRVLLRAAKKSKKSLNPSTARTSKHRSKPTTCEQPVKNIVAGKYPTSIGSLFAGISQSILDHVQHYLRAPSVHDAMVLDAWARVGRQDAARSTGRLRPRIQASATTPFGLACLIRYTRAFEDELAARADTDIYTLKSRHQGG
jgi:hypothetical protein